MRLLFHVSKSIHLKNFEANTKLCIRNVRVTKGGFFFRKCDSFFRSPNLEKKIFQKTILNLKFKIPAQNSIMLWAGILNFKFKIVFWNIFFSKFGDLKNESHFLEKSHLYNMDSCCTRISATYGSLQRHTYDELPSVNVFCLLLSNCFRPCTS